MDTHTIPEKYKKLYTLIPTGEAMGNSQKRTTYEHAVKAYQNEKLSNLYASDLTFNEYHMIYVVKYYKAKKTLLRRGKIL